MLLLFNSCDRPGRVLIGVTQTIEINDPYGPTLTGPTFNAIIVSEETQKVGQQKRGALIRAW
jgi:phosphopantetheine adenylyltransferase